MCGTIRVCVHEWLPLGLDMERLDQIVWFEIDVARRNGFISERLASLFWSQWCGSGEEMMDCSLAQWEEGDVRSP